MKKQRSKPPAENKTDRKDQDQHEPCITVFIDHFDWGYDDPVMMNEKLDVLLFCLKLPEICFIIQSGVSFKTIQDYYQGVIRDEEEKENEKDSDEKTDAIFLKKIINKSERLEAMLTTRFIPVNVGILPSPGQNISKHEIDDKYASLIREELQASDYLRQFEEVVVSFYNNSIKGSRTENAGDRIINKINFLAADYYEDLFASCTPQEQYVLFDMAEDLITNPNNVEPVLSLLVKGIFVRKKDKLNLMNMSFRRFLLSKRRVIDKAALEIRIGKKPGSWQGYRITLTLVIIGLFVFIYMTNQAFIADLNEIFVILGGGIAVITGLIGLLSRTTKSIED